MSRSIHETRRMIRETHREEWGNREDQEKRLAGLYAKLDRKKLIKQQVAEGRKGLRTIQAEEELITTTDPAGIPILIEDKGPYIHYPATPDDLRAIMHRLPQGVCDGLSEIVLCLCDRDEPADHETPGEFKPDPYTGRIGREMLPDIWTRGFLGWYFADPARIRLHAFVYPPEIKDRAIKEFLLKLRALSTFVHEVAHHHDFTRRQARGRWLLEEEDRKAEDYAGEMQYHWLHEVVAPYLEKAYPDEAKRFIDWVEHYGGVRLTLDQMAGDPRKYVFNIQETLVFLFEWVHEGKDLIVSRTEFADFLHMSEFYTEAMFIVERLLTDTPDNIAVIRLKAHILADQGHYAEARELALKVIEMDPEYAEAWFDLRLACEGLELWEEVIVAATREFELLEVKDPRFKYRALRPRIRARMALRDFAGAEADIQLLEQSPHKWYRADAKGYRDKLAALANALGKDSEDPK